MRIRHIVLMAAGALLCPSVALAYPTSVIFIPTGDANELGDADLNAYVPMQLSPTAEPASTWLGTQIGLIPKFAYGDSGTGFGGLEVGIDVINPYQYGDGDPTVKTVLNFKLGLLTEYKWIPHVAVGAMQLGVFKPSQSMNFFYLAASKTLEFGGTSYGRLTAGVGHNFTDDPAVFNGSHPLFLDKKQALLLGYESPKFGPVYFAVDHFGGTSEASSSNIGAFITPSDNTYIGLGGWFSNDRRGGEPADGVFCLVGITWNWIDLLKKKESKD